MTQQSQEGTQIGQMPLGTEIFNPQGDNLGELKFFSVNAQTGEVTNIIVHTGNYCDTDKKIPVEEILAVHDRRIIVGLDSQSMQEKEDFIEKHFGNGSSSRNRNRSNNNRRRSRYRKNRR